MSVLVEIKEIIDDIRPILKFSAISETSIEKLTVLLMRVDGDEQLTEFRDWLNQFRDGPVKDVRDIYNLKPPEWWENMSAFGITQTREFRLLAQAKKKLRAGWRIRYGQKQSNSNSDSGNSESMSVQSDEARTDEGNSGN